MTGAICSDERRALVADWYAPEIKLLGYWVEVSEFLLVANNTLMTVDAVENSVRSHGDP